MIDPGPVVDAVRNLEEDDEVLSPEVELSVGAAEVKASLLRQLALGILPDVAPPLGLRLTGADPNRLRRSPVPEQDFSPLEPALRHFGPVLVNRAGIAPEGLFRVVSHRDD